MSDNALLILCAAYFILGSVSALGFLALRNLLRMHYRLKKGGGDARPAPVNINRPSCKWCHENLPHPGPAPGYCFGGKDHGVNRHVAAP